MIFRTRSQVIPSHSCPAYYCHEAKSFEELTSDFGNMLEWLTGSTRTADVQGPRIGIYLEIIETGKGLREYRG